MQEEWRDISGYEGRYQVSNLGRVKSLPGKSRGKSFGNKVLVQFEGKYGYAIVNLSRKSHLVHRLVAKAFIDNPNNYRCVNHKDENKKNNTVDNLEWCTYKYNSNYGTRNERISKNGGRPIVQYDLQGNFVKRWRSIAEVSRFYGVRRTTICGCCAGRQHTSCGYVWRYENAKV